jgi:hypothetical protein
MTPEVVLREIGKGYAAPGKTMAPDTPQTTRSQRINDFPDTMMKVPDEMRNGNDAAASLLENGRAPQPRRRRFLTVR